MTDQVLKVAAIGLGRMGGAMARRFSSAGFDVTLWNRDPSKAVEIARDTGADVAPTAAAAAAHGDIIVSSLADDVALLDVYLGREGVIAGIKSGSVAVDTSTVDPSTILTVSAAIAESGARLADCPVSGSVSTVESGTLTIMAGGDVVAIEQAKPVLDSISKRVIRVGGPGAGAACKLAVNSLLHGLNIALSEALVLAERAGIGRETAYEVFASGAAGAPFLDYKRAAFTDPDGTPVAFSLALVAKDLDLITELGSRVGAPMQQAETGRRIVRAAIDSGMAEDDLSAIAVFLRKEAG
ncbi:MAG TPA: NAD(P)-dependent oxidoreductase [Acidimicrobiia bacterium]